MINKELKIKDIKNFLIKNFSEENNISVIEEMIIKSREYSKFLPNDGLGWVSLATALSKKFKLQKDNSFSKEIVDAYENYLVIDDSNPLIYINLAVELEKSNKNKAQEVYEKTLLKFPKNEILLLHYSNLFFKKNDYEKAKDILLKIIEINDKNEQALQNIAYIYQKQAMLEDAEKYYKKAFILNPNETNYISLSSIYLRLEKNLIAEKFLLEGLKKYPRSDRICNNLIVTYSKLGKFKDKINLEEKIFGLIEFNKHDKPGEFRIKK